MSRGLRLAALAAALYLAGVLVWVRYDRRSSQEAFSPGSVFNTGEDGLSLAFAYLRERAGARTLHRGISAEDLPANGVVLRVQALTGPILLGEEEEEDEEQKDDKDSKDGKDEKDEEGPLDELRRKKREEEERRAKEEKERKKKEGEEEPEEAPVLRFLSSGEEAWVRGGGRLVLAFAHSYGPGRAKELEGKQSVRKVFPLWPGVANLVLPTARSLDIPPLPGGHAVFLAGESPLMVRQALGAGDLILLAAPEILHNPHLGQAHHLALLEALAGVPERRPVLFDERAHGLDDSGGILDILAGWGLGPLLLLGLIATGAAFWRSGKRLGPPEREERDTRSDAVELLDSLADLYDRALQRGDAVFLFYESFVHTVAVETGLRGKALEERSKTLLDGYTAVQGEELSRERFDEALRKINQAFRRVSHAKRDAKRK